MTHAIFHIIFAILIAEVIREYLVKDKGKFPIYYVFIIGLAGILPDIDVLAFWILYFFGFTLQEVHRTFTHTLFIPLIFLIAATITNKIRNKITGKRYTNLKNIFLLISLGVFIHLLLDATIAGVIKPLYPLLNFSFGLNLINLLPYALQQIFLPSLDAGIFILWLLWLEYKHKISNFI